jgi:hypothetical protein
MLKPISILDEYHEVTRKYKEELRLEEFYSLLDISRTYDDMFSGYPLTASMVVSNFRDTIREGKIIQHFISCDGIEERENRLRLININITLNRFIDYLRDNAGKATKEALENSKLSPNFDENLKRFIGFLICEEKYENETLISPEANRTMFYLCLYRELRNEVYHSTMKANKYYNYSLDAEKSYEILSQSLNRVIEKVKYKTNPKLFIQNERKALSE